MGAPFGLSALMEATKQSDRNRAGSDALLEAFDDRIDDDVIAAVTGKDDDDLESDMEGDGVGDEEEMEKLLEKIPPSDQMAEEEVESISEAFLAEELGEPVI